MFKVNNKETITSCEICSKLTIKTPERRQLIESKIWFNINLVLLVDFMSDLITLISYRKPLDLKSY